MLVQPIAVVAGGGTSGRVVNPADASTSTKPGIIRDGVASGGVAVAEAASCLSTQLVDLAASVAGGFVALCAEPNNPDCACEICAALQAEEANFVRVVWNPPAPVRERITSGGGFGYINGHTWPKW